MLEASQEKMLHAGEPSIAIQQFERMYHSYTSQGSQNWVREADITPMQEVPSFKDIYQGIDHHSAVQAFAKTAFLKLNGGLGTSMGLSCAKSLLMVRRHKARPMRFLDIIVGQVLTARVRLEVPLPLVFLNSFRTSKDTLDALKGHRILEQGNIPNEIIQHSEPKLDEATNLPISWPSNPELEWCPAGHGDLFSVLWSSNLLKTLQEQGFSYLFVSNSDNLGARPSRTLAQYFENTKASMMVEVARRTDADRKGGHFVRDKHTGQLILREMSQVHPEDAPMAQDIERHPYFNTNSIWFRIDALQELLDKHQGILDLPVIANRKTVDPTDPHTPRVVQLEIAMGSISSYFDDAICVQVDRMRFLPVKTTDDLFIMRSDRFHLTDSYEMEDGNYLFPDVRLDPRYYHNIDDFNQRFPYSVPSIGAANSVTIEGDWTFGRDVAMFANARLEDRNEPSYVPNGEYVGPSGIEPDDWVY